MAIVLRKLGGKLTPTLRATRSRYGLPFVSARGALTGFLSSPLVLAVLALAFVVAWVLTHGGFHGAAFAIVPFVGQTETNLLAEKAQEYGTKTKKVGDILGLISNPEDYGKKEVLDMLGAQDTAEARDKMKAFIAEVDALGRDVDMLNIEHEKRKNSARLEELKRPQSRQIPGSSIFEPKSFGDLVTTSKDWNGSRTPFGTKIPVDLGENGVKTLLQTSAGWQPRTGNGDILVDKIIRPVQVLDLFPSDRTDLFEIPSMEETTRTQAAAELAEAGTYQEDAFAFTRRTSPVRKIGSEIPVTDEQLDDVPQMAGLLNNRLIFGVRARIDQQIVVGDGTGSTLTGLLNASNIQTQLKGADPTANAILKAITLVRVTGRSMPTHVMMHGTDIQNLRLSQNAQGDYQFGPPYVAGESRVWDLPLVQTEALTQGTALVCSLNPLWVCLYFRKDIEVQLGYINDQFIKGQKTIRGDARVALWIGRGQSICKVTGL